MIQGRSNFVYRIKNTNTFVSKGLKDNYDTTEIHVDINLVYNDRLDVDAFRKWRPEYENAEFILEDGEYVCGWAVEKMSKSMFNVVNPDSICEKYGADTLRLYEMFLGPVEMSKPWDTKGIDGVHRFLKKFWRLFFGGGEGLGDFSLSEEEPSAAELKILHKLIGKVETDIESFSYNTSVSAFMVAVNELGALKCNKRKILVPMIVLLSPFAPHIAEELWQLSGHSESVSFADFPMYHEEYTREDSFEYPVSFNGKTRFKLSLPKSLDKEEAEKAVMEAPETEKYLAGKPVKKVIVVPGRIINVVF